MFFFVLPRCENLFYTLYLLTFPTFKCNKLLNQGNVGAKDHSKLCGHQKPPAVLPNPYVPYEFLQNPAGKHCIAHLLLLAQQKRA
jgi:hypothetical protein